jgi:hypothetical protein
MKGNAMDKLGVIINLGFGFALVVFASVLMVL